MKYCLFLLMFVMPGVLVYGQDVAKKEDVAASIKRPQYPGGEKEMQQYFALHLHYPAVALAESVEGEVMVSFTVEADGKISHVKTLNKIGHGCEEEAERVVKSMPAWKPATKGGKAIAVNYKLPVVFELPDNPVLNK